MERRNHGGKDADGRPTEDRNPTSAQIITLECFSSLQGTRPIKRFLKDVKGFSTPPKENTTSVFRPVSSGSRRAAQYGDSWLVAVTRPARSLDSVALEESKKHALVQDIAYYLTPECERFYANRGYPYRRGFLFYGPLGTGKTSFSVALARHFKLNVYILSMSDEDMTDSRLENLFAVLPSRCIVLLEDVDSAGLQRESSAAEQKAQRKKSKKKTYPSFVDPKKSKLTLSGMLNCLDGPTSKDGRIVCMTSNAPDSLDAALVRPGRCDRKVLFGYASEEMCLKLFTHLYTKMPEKLLHGETSASMHHDIRQLAKDFTFAIPCGGKITPAEVQGYLMLHCEDPQAAVDGAYEFVQEILDIKAKGKNVAAHANEIQSPEDDLLDMERDMQSVQEPCETPEDDDITSTSRNSTGEDDIEHTEDDPGPHDLLTGLHGLVEEVPPEYKLPVGEPDSVGVIVPNFELLNMLYW